MLKNKGSSVIEATLALPLFIFCVLAFYAMGRCKMAELQIYEACSETAEYIAEQAYINGADLILPSVYFEKYLDNDGLVERYIKGGSKGVSFILGTKIDEDGFLTLKASYEIKISLPFINKLTKRKQISIRQKVYRGYKPDEDPDIEEYVFVTESGEVYHTNRNCSYMSRHILQVFTQLAADKGYEECRLCGQYCGDKVYVTEDGESYHSTKACSSLKRTVYRAKLADLKGVNKCHLCK